MKYKGLTAKVLERKAARRQKRWKFYGGIIRISILGVFLCVLFYGIHDEHRRLRPTWAAFSTTDTFQEMQPAAWPDGVPAHLLVNGQEWSIVRVTSFDDYNGGNANGSLAQTYCNNQTIAYIPSESAAELRINLMHEIFHAGACLHGGDEWWNSIKPTRVDHPGIYHLGEFMAEFSLANPDFMRWMSEK